MWTRLWTRPSAWGHPYTPKGVTTPGRSTAHTHKGTAVDLKAEQLDSATAARGSATSALKQRAPASRDHSCVPALPACSPLWRATFLVVHDLHHDQYLLALATRYRSDTAPSPVTVVAFSPAALLWTRVLPENATRELSCSVSGAPAFGQ
jgi:hypothetical protein